MNVTKCPNCSKCFFDNGTQYCPHCKYPLLKADLENLKNSPLWDILAQFFGENK